MKMASRIRQTALKRAIKAGNGKGKGSGGGRIKVDRAEAGAHAAAQQGLLP